MEMGKYISLGNGIQVRKSKKETYTYYYSFRDKKNNNKVTRKKLFSSETADNKAFKKAILLSEKVLDVETNEIDINEKYTLLYLKRFYFDKKIEMKHFELKNRYNHLTNEELLNNTNYKNKMQNTRKEEKRFDKAFLNTDIVNKDIRILNRNEVESFLNTEIHSMTEKSFSNLLGLVRAIINFANKKEIIDCKNPFSNLDLNLKNIKKNRTRYLTKDEITSLLFDCRNYTSDINVFNSVYLAILTAARKATILNIRKKDFNFETSSLNLYNLKSEKSYTIILNTESLNYFKNYLKDYEEDEYVIRAKNIDRRNKQAFRDVPKRVFKIMDEMFNKTLDKSNNKDRDNVVNFHTLRRSVATNLALDNVSIYKIMRLLNHSNIKQTQDYLNLSNLNMTTEIESTHSNLYELVNIEKEQARDFMSIERYREYLKNNNFSDSKELYNFENEVSSWKFRLESNHIDGFQVDDFSSIEGLLYYLEHRNMFSNLKDYQDSYKTYDMNENDW